MEKHTKGVIPNGDLILKLRALFQTKLHLVQLPLLILFRKLAELHQAELTTPFKYGRYVLNLQN